MSVWLRKYGTGTGSNIIIPMIQAGSQDFATNSEWTPTTGDIKISKDGAAAANINTLPTYISNVGWNFVFSDEELEASRININIVDSATKTVEDQHIIIETYGNASAQHAFDLNEAMPTVPTANENADALLDRANSIETDITFREAMRLISSILLGKVSGGGTTTNTFTNATGSKTRITATVDENGNRTSITLDAT